MLKLPKGLKKKKKGKKSKRKDEELFTEEELEKYRKEHQAGASTHENEEWSKFQDLTTGIDSVLRKTQGDLDRIKSTSFFQRVPAGPREVDSVGKEVKQTESSELPKPVVEVTEADFPQITATAAAVAEPEYRSEAPSEEESDDEEQDDIFDTSYVEAVERGEVCLAYVPDSPEEVADDDIFDTSHIDALIKGQDAKADKRKKTIDIGVAVEVLTGRIDNVTLTTSKRLKRVIPGDLLLENDGETPIVPSKKATPEGASKSILDVDEEIPISTPIDLSVSLHTSLIQQNQTTDEDHLEATDNEPEDDDEFAQLAAESRDINSEAITVYEEEIKAEPVLEESWSVFEADKSQSVFAESIVEDQLDVIDAYGDDPFDTSFADAVIPSVDLTEYKSQNVLPEDDDDFDPRADEVKLNLNNRRKSTVRIHLTDPTGLRESITSDDISVKEDTQLPPRDFLGGSTTDLTKIGDSPLNPRNVDSDVEDAEFDPFDTSNVDNIVAPGRAELGQLEKELIEDSVQKPIFRVPSDPDFDPRAEEPVEVKVERRPSRPENLVVKKNVVFIVDNSSSLNAPTKPPKPVTPFYARALSITEDANEEAEASDSVSSTLIRTRSDEDLVTKIDYEIKRRHSEFPQSNNFSVTGNLSGLPGSRQVTTKVLTPLAPKVETPDIVDEYSYDPFDTSFAANIAPGRAELSILAKEFSCEEVEEDSGERDLLEPAADDFFQVKALSPEPSTASRLPQVEHDPFDTSFADGLQPGKGELKLLESELLN